MSFLIWMAVFGVLAFGLAVVLVGLVLAAGLALWDGELTR